MKRMVITLVLGLVLGLFAVAMFFLTSDPMELTAWLHEQPEVKPVARAPAPPPPAPQPLLRQRRAECLGVTWTVAGSKDFVVWVGPHAASNGAQGDSPCAKTLPMLCINPNAKAPAPTSSQPPLPWFPGEVALVDGVQGTELTSREVADGKCAHALGAGWRMASLNGRGFATQGELPRVERFWISSTSTFANPWDP